MMAKVHYIDSMVLVPADRFRKKRVFFSAAMALLIVIAIFLPSIMISLYCSDISTAIIPNSAISTMPLQAHIDQSTPRQVQVAVIVSGLLERLLTAAIDNLGTHIIFPQNASGYTVDVYASLQEGSSNKLNGWFKHTMPEEKAQKVFTQVMHAYGARKVYFQTLPQPDASIMTHIYPWSSSLFQNATGRKTKKKTRNIFMYQNMKEGFLLSQASQTQPYDLYVRTRSDNFMLQPHYVGYANYFDTLDGCQVVVPKCRSYGGIYDKFAIMTPPAAAVFFNILEPVHYQHILKEVNSEGAWKSALNVDNCSFIFTEPPAFSVSNVATSPTARSEQDFCYRSFEGCVSTLQHEVIKTKHQDC